jgi:pantoate--beta-alanine ligase
MTGIQVISSRQELNVLTSKWKLERKSVGLVPTMGALHKGHLSLVNTACKHNDICIVSIFVNPTQFNNTDDLKKYPRTLKEDIELLKSTDCTFVFTPEVDTIYDSQYEALEVELGVLDEVMEGVHRPGHFNGVMNVVERFFRLILPTRAYFGRKDFQQAAVIGHMTRTLKLPVELIICPTIREKSGLAMSSRNSLLSTKGKVEAQFLFEVLEHTAQLSSSFNPANAQEKAVQLCVEKNIELEYLEIVHPQTLVQLKEDWVPGATACIVAYVEGVRLIDNLELIPSKVPSVSRN